MGVTEIHDEDAFQAALVAAKGKLVVVDFFATWCGPCKVVAPIFDEWSRKYEKEAVFLKVDVDKVREVAQEAGVKQLPSFGFYHNSRLLELTVGGDVKSLEKKITSLSEKYSTFAFKGAGNSMLGPSSAAPAAGKPVAAAAAAAPSGRRNPWADPNFHLAKAAAAPVASSTPVAAAAKPAPAAAAKPVAAAAAAPAAKPAPAPVAAKPAAAPVAAAAVAAKPAAAAPSDSSRVNPWATKEISKAPAAAAPATPVSPAPAAKPVAAAASASPPAAVVASSSPAPTAMTDDVAPAAASSSAPAGPAVNDPALIKQLNPGFLSNLRDMGFSQLRVEKSLILTGNKGVDKALNWLMEHENDPDIDEPLQVVGTQAKAPAGVDLDAMDEDERAIYENMQAKKMASKGVAFAGGANAGPAKVSTLDMTSEEKMAWLANRRAEVKARKAQEAIDSIKEKEQTRKKTVKSAQVADELKEAQQRKAADDAIRAKRKEEDEKKKARANILAKLEEDKQRRRVQKERDMEAIAAQKAAAEAAKANK